MSTAEDALVRKQFLAVVPDIPRLYATVIVVVVFVLLLLLPVAPPAIVGAWAAVLVSVAILRGMHWRKVAGRMDSYTVAEKRSQLTRINKTGPFLLAFFVSAGFLVLLTPDLLLRTVTMFAIWAAAVGTAFYLSVLPRCANQMVWGATTCLCMVLVWSGGPVLYVAAALFLAVSYAFGVQLKRNFDQFKAAVDANHTIDQLRREALKMAMTDPLTGLPNRRAFDERLAMLAANEQPFALAAIDLDGFKPVNDAFGHGVGDKVLVLVAQRLLDMSSTVFVARFGGDEFVLLIEGADFVEPILQRAMAAMSKPYEIDRVPIYMGASCGLAFWRKPGDEHDVMKRADAALYLAKARPGRNQELESGRYVIIKSAA